MNGGFRRYMVIPRKWDLEVEGTSGVFNSLSLSRGRRCDAPSGSRYATFPGWLIPQGDLAARSHRPGFSTPPLHQPMTGGTRTEQVGVDLSLRAVARRVARVTGPLACNSSASYSVATPDFSLVRGVWGFGSPVGVLVLFSIAEAN